MDERIKQIMSAVFEVPANEINESSSTDNVYQWDSIRHLNLVVSLEEEFEIEFEEEEIINLLNFELIKEIVTSKL